MDTNNISQVTQDEINQLKRYRDEFVDFVNGMDYCKPDDKFAYSHKANILFGWHLNWSKFTLIKSVIGRIWPHELKIIDEIQEKIEYNIIHFNGGVVIDKGRLRPNDEVSECSLTLIEKLNRIIELAEQNAEQPAGTERNTKRIVAAFLISLLIICAFILSVWLIPFTPFTWFRNHPHSYGIQGSIICLIPSFIFGFFKPDWRKWCWGTAAIAFLVGLLSLL
jgi:hypothetical protein